MALVLVSVPVPTRSAVQQYWAACVGYGVGTGAGDRTGVGTNTGAAAVLSLGHSADTGVSAVTTGRADKFTGTSASAVDLILVPVSVLVPSYWCRE